MKIAYISTAEVPSNRANSLQVMKVSQALLKLGHSVQLYLPTGRNVSWEELAETYGLTESFPVTRLPSRSLFKRMDFTLASLSRARREKADLVYTRMVWTALLARLGGFLTVLELHDQPVGRFGPMVYRWYIRLKKPKLTVYITRALKQLVDQHVGAVAIPAEAIIAPDGVDLDLYHNLPEPSQARTALGLPEEFTAVYTGGFYPGRGLELLEPLAQAFPQVRFVWIGGDAEQVNTWSVRLAEKGISNVTLTGHISNQRVPLCQAAADILLLPYSHKFGGSGGGNIAGVSSPLKLFEYLAAGRAILASDLPVLREVLNEDLAAFYPPEDFSALCSSFAGLLADSGKRHRLGDAARNAAQAYDWRTRMRMIMDAVTSLTTNK